MTMHLICGVRDTGSKKRTNKKPGWQKAEKEHRAFLRKMGINPDAKPVKKEFVKYEQKESIFRRETAHVASRSAESIPDAGLRKESPKYSGDYIVGIATMHKSNLVPVGRGDNPEDYANMRR